MLSKKMLVSVIYNVYLYVMLQPISCCIREIKLFTFRNQWYDFMSGFEVESSSSITN